MQLADDHFQQVAPSETFNVTAHFIFHRRPCKWFKCKVVLPDGITHLLLPAAMHIKDQKHSG